MHLSSFLLLWWLIHKQKLHFTKLKKFTLILQTSCKDCKAVAPIRPYDLYHYRNPSTVTIRQRPVLTDKYSSSSQQVIRNFLDTGRTDLFEPALFYFARWHTQASSRPGCLPVTHTQWKTPMFFACRASGCEKNTDIWCTPEQKRGTEREWYTIQVVWRHESKTGSNQVSNELLLYIWRVWFVYCESNNAVCACWKTVL